MRKTGLKSMYENKDDALDALDIKKGQALETLRSILGTIKNSDEKAASLLTAAGIIFGLSAFSLDMLKGKTNDVQKVFPDAGNPGGRRSDDDGCSRRLPRSGRGDDYRRYLPFSDHRHIPAAV